MIQLNDRVWKEFKIKEIFETINGNSQVPTGAYIEKDYLKNGLTPRITVTSANNGVDAFWDTSHKNKREFNNFISVNFLGDAFYHPYTATLDMKVHSLKLVDKSYNLDLASFICCTLKNNTKYSTYGNQLSSKDIISKSILLPIDKEGNPDYAFMEEYIKKCREELQKEYDKFIATELQDLGEEKEIVSLGEKKWSDFFIDEIFTIGSGKRLESYNMIEGKVPFIGAIDNSNGITNYVSNKNESIDRNVLGVNYNGNGMVISFYHPYDCLFSDDVKRFHLRRHLDNKFVLLFFKTIILQQKNKYNYGYKFNSTRMKRQKILVPIDENSDPDYVYMEQYMKNIFIKKYKAYVNYHRP